VSTAAGHAAHPRGAPGFFPPRSGDPLEQALGAVAQRIRESVFRRMGTLGLSPPTAGALAHLAQGPVAMRALAERLQCDASYVTGIADRLEEHGYAERRPEPGDRRVKLLALTDAGLAAWRELQTGLLAEFPGAATLSAAERETLVDLLGRLLADR
jgi:DNA-binding MarR family transcriptional regulator